MSLPRAFSQTGLHIRRATDMPIARFQVLGERSSGTNFVKRLIGRNSALKPTEALGWKHSAPHMLAIPADMAMICVVRRADTWARSMFQKPWHTTPQMQALPFSGFLRAEWDTIIDRPRYFKGLVPEGSKGAPLQADRDPMTGRRYGNLFLLRRAKLDAHLSVLGRDCTCKTPFPSDPKHQQTGASKTSTFCAHKPTRHKKQTLAMPTDPLGTDQKPSDDLPCSEKWRG